MYRLLLIIMSCTLFLSCKRTLKPISTVEISTVMADKSLNIRALSIQNDTIVVATSDGRTLQKADADVLFYTLYEKDTINNPNFRAIAQQANNVFTLSIGSPALLYKNGKLVYTETHKKVFYDAMQFWNNQEGIAMGDPTDNCLSILITRDGGETWQKMPCSALPKLVDGEAAFAASNTNIAIMGDNAWIATGGKGSRIYHTADKGKTWSVFNTPIIQGKETTGMYSVAFYNEFLGFAIGGDYTKPEAAIKNKIRTIDGGKTWHSVAKGSPPGYRSCVQFVPNSNGKELIATGFKGIDYSNDFGETWMHLSDEGFYTIKFLTDRIAYVAGSGRVARVVFN